MKHTPTPWEQDGFQGIQDDMQVFRAAQLVDAAFIVRAVNCHDELLELAKWVRASFKADERPANLDALIAKAEGK